MRVSIHAGRFSHCWFNKQQTVHSSLNNYNTKENNNQIKKTLVKDPFSVVNKKMHFAFVATVFFRTNQKSPPVTPATLPTP